MAAPTVHDYRSARLALRWWEWGDPSAPPMLLVHGGRDHGRSWDDVAAAFADRYRVVAPDLRGHGQSEWSSGGAYQLEDYVYDLTRLAAELGVSAERPATIVGHSLGGGIATVWTALHPDRVRRLVSIEGLGPSVRQQEERAAEGIAPRLHRWIDTRLAAERRGLRIYPDLAAAVARMRAVHPQLSPALAEHLTRHGVRDVSYGVRFVHDPLLSAWPPFDLPRADRESLWSAITCPTLLVYGGKSWASNPAQDGRAAHFRDAQVRLFEEAGHWVHHDAGDAFVAAVAAFVA